MPTIKKISLGAFAAGEIPGPIVHTFLDKNGTAIDIDGWTVLGFYVEGPEGDVDMGNPTITDGPNGVVTYEWQADDLQVPGDYSGLLWVQNTVSNPSLRLASDRFVWTVEDGPGPTPPEVPA